ncbi:MAG: restriction endonuclease subunit S [Bacteroidaceae bacterium]|nr:restriction endonuclease subunit S [Bacteroidaceae bacterium]
MQQYSEYKASGVQWLGEIPSHWEVKRLGKICKFSKGLQFTKTDLVNQGIAVVSYGQVHAKYNKRTHLSDDLIRFIPSDFRGKNEKAKVEIGDFIVADTSEDIEGCGNMAFNDCIEGLYGGSHTILIKELQIACKKYLSYFFNCTQWRSQIRSLVNGVKVYTINRDILKQSNVICPSKEEQKNIVNYLDIVTSNIDKAITQQQKMIDLLNERKQIIINNAVTKGLEPNVKMKDSGVEWIGKIPVHWKVRKLKFLLVTTLQYGANESAESDDESYPRYIRITDIDEEGHLKPETFRSLLPSKAEPYLLKKGDILFARSGATAGKTYLFKEDFKACFAGYLIRAKLKEILAPEYLNYYTKSGIYDSWKKSIFIQATIPNIGADKYANLHITLPPKDDQHYIVQHLNMEVGKINQIIKKCNQQISLLQERKQIIINDVVTGKVKVV